MAFVSNRRDEAKLGSRRYRSRIVDGIYAGLLDYAQRRGWLKKGVRSASR
jgi:N-acetylmuramoyl-L-alanine amidase